jgi:hypothetical protein
MSIFLNITICRLGLLSLLAIGLGACGRGDNSPMVFNIPTHPLIGPSTSTVVSPVAVDITWNNQNFACAFNCNHALDPSSLAVKLDATTANVDVSRQFTVDPTGSRATAILALALGDHTLDASGMLLPTPGVLGVPGLPGHPTSGRTGFTVVQYPLTFDPPTVSLNFGQTATVTVIAGETPTTPVNVWLVPDLVTANVVRLGSQPPNAPDTITIQPPSTSAVETITGNLPGTTTIFASAASQALGSMTVTVFPLPKPDALDPTHGVVGADIRISGANFNPSQVVTVDQSPAPSSFVNQGEIHFSIPQISAGAHSVAVQGQGSLGLTVDAGTLTASPSPFVATIGQASPLTVTLPAAAPPPNGVSLSVTASPSNLALIGPLPPVPTGNLPTSTSITGQAVGSGELQLSGTGYAPLAVPLTISPPPPTLTGIDPTHGVIGTDVGLSGTNFDPSQVVTVDQSPVPSSFVNQGEIHFNIPQVSIGPHVVSVAGSNSLSLTVDPGTLTASPTPFRSAVGQTSPLTITVPVVAPPNGVTLSVSASPSNLVQIGPIPPVAANSTSTMVNITGRASGSGTLQISGTGFTSLALPLSLSRIVLRTSNVDVQAFDFANAANPVVVSQQPASVGGAGGNNAADIASDGSGHVFRTSTTDLQMFPITPGGILSPPVSSVPATATLSSTGVALAAVGPSGTRGPLIVRSFEQGVDVFELVGNTLTLRANCRPIPGVCPTIATVNVGTAIDLAGTLAVRSKDVGIEVIDVTMPTAPVLRGHFDMGESAMTGSAIKIFAAGARAVRGTPSGIEVYDISTPATPRLIGAAHGTPASTGVAVTVDSTGMRAVRVHGAGIEIYDITNPTNPSLAGGVGGSPGTQLAMALIGTTAFRGTELQIEAFDISVPTMIRRLGSTPSSGPNATTFSANAVGLVAP